MCATSWVKLWVNVVRSSDTFIQYKKSPKAQWISLGYFVVVFFGGGANEIASARYLVANYLSKVLETVYSAHITSPSSEKSFRSLCILILKVHGSYIFIFSV